jgi:hypothetical protein
MSIMMITASIRAEENIIHDDGTGAQICFHLPTRDIKDGRMIEYTTFSITVVKNDKFLLLTGLTGSKTEDGKTFYGDIIIPSNFVDSAEIIMAGSPLNSSLGVSNKIRVNTFKKIYRNKSWTDQK